MSTNPPRNRDALQTHWEAILKADGMGPIDYDGRVPQVVYDGPHCYDVRFERLADALDSDQLDILAPRHRRAAESKRLVGVRDRDAAICRLLAEGKDVAGRHHPERHAHYHAAIRLRKWACALIDDVSSDPLAEVASEHEHGTTIVEIFAEAQSRYR